MKKIAQLISKPLRWFQPSTFQRQFELQANEEVVATLRFRSLCGTLATGEGVDGCWTFKRVGFWQTSVTIRECNSDLDIATFKNNTWSGGGTLELPGGKEYRATTNFWNTRFEFQDQSGATVIEFKTGGLLHLSATVEINPAAAALPEMPWLVMLGWYLILMMYMDASVAGAAGGAVA